MKTIAAFASCWALYTYIHVVCQRFNDTKLNIANTWQHDNVYEMSEVYHAVCVPAMYPDYKYLIESLDEWRCMRSGLLAAASSFLGIIPRNEGKHLFTRPSEHAHYNTPPHVLCICLSWKLFNRDPFLWKARQWCTGMAALPGFIYSERQINASYHWHLFKQMGLAFGRVLPKCSLFLSDGCFWFSVSLEHIRMFAQSWFPVSDWADSFSVLALVFFHQSAHVFAHSQVCPSTLIQLVSLGARPQVLGSWHEVGRWL